MHHILINSPAGWSIGLLYEEPAMPQHLEMYLKNMQARALTVQNFSEWLINHKVKAIAFCAGTLVEKMRTKNFCK